MDGRTTIAKEYKDILTNAKGIVIVDVTAAIAQQAAILSAKYNFRTPDAIQLATAIEFNADYFLTNDSRLKSANEMDIVAVADLQ